jgi:hypothetical protein
MIERPLEKVLDGARHLLSQERSDLLLVLAAESDNLVEQCWLRQPSVLTEKPPEQAKGVPCPRQVATNCIQIKLKMRRNKAFAAPNDPKRERIQQHAPCESFALQNPNERVGRSEAPVKPLWRVVQRGFAGNRQDATDWPGRIRREERLAAIFLAEVRLHAFGFSELPTEHLGERLDQNPAGNAGLTSPAQFPLGVPKQVGGVTTGLFRTREVESRQQL